MNLQSGRARRPRRVSAEPMLLRRRNVSLGSIGQLDVERQPRADWALSLSPLRPYTSFGIAVMARSPMRIACSTTSVGCSWIHRACSA